MTHMHFGHAQYLPIALPLFALLAGALALLLILVQIRVLRYAYMQLGVSSGTAFFLLFASLFGSYINIPIAALGQETMVTEREVTYFGMRYIVPVMVGSPGVILAVNVGGAVIPTLLSIYLLTKNRLWKRGLIAIACVAAICHGLAQPVHGVGIALPIFVPPLVAAVIAAVVSWKNAAPLAYAGGSLGVLIGADLLNLGKLQGLGAPVVSIGGAGTFDGIFVTGLTICHGLAQPVHGVGIALPIFVPPLVAAVIAAVVSWRNAAPLAYAGGSLGVLIGADLLNLGKLEGLGAPVVSIGGAGTFDGIFVTGLMAVLLAGLTGRRTAR